MEFVNTADVIGDDEMCDRIIMRTVTEYKENRISKVGACAFNGCTALTVVDVPEVTTIASNAFNGCTKLTSINAPSVNTIGRLAFAKCTALENVCFPSLVGLGDSSSSWETGAFFNCTALKSVDLPVCEQIANFTFYKSANLTVLILRNTKAVCTLGNIDVFNSTPIAEGTGYIYVPSDLVGSYKDATNWSAYAAQIRAIEEYTVDGKITGELDASKI